MKGHGASTEAHFEVRSGEPRSLGADAQVGETRTLLPANICRASTRPTVALTLSGSDLE